MITGDMLGNLAVFLWAAAVDLPSLGQKLRQRGPSHLSLGLTFGALLLLGLLGLGLGLAGAQLAYEGARRSVVSSPTQLVFCSFLFGAFSKARLPCQLRRP